MNGSPDLVQSMSSALFSCQAPADTAIQVVICPPLPLLSYVRQYCPGWIQLGAQQVSSRPKHGAHTGEVSATILKHALVDWVIIGHSERRNLTPEQDDNPVIIQEKMKTCLDEDIGVIYCIGESLPIRQSNTLWPHLCNQLSSVLTPSFIQDIISSTISTKPFHQKLVIAYEPIWAIGTGIVATPDQIQEVHQQIRQWIITFFPQSLASKIRILYGGSVNSKICASIHEIPNVDGFLVGGASILPGEFVSILTMCNKDLHPHVTNDTQ